MQNQPQKDFTRGLFNFISSIHHVKNKEEELKLVQRELAKIRNYYKEEKTADGYQRRKCVGKLIYMYIFGYDLDFGHMETIQLMTAGKFHEKQMGYLGVQLLVGEGHELAPLIVNSLQDDILGRNEAVQCLALATVANIGGKEITETMAPIVLKLMLSTTTPTMVKKKACMAYQRIIKRNKSIISLDPELPTKIISMLEENNNLGVLNAVCVVLLEAVQSMDTAPWMSAAPKLIKVLTKVANKELSRDHMYHSVPHPWLQVRCLRLLKFLPPGDAAATSSMGDLLRRILETESGRLNSDNSKNAQNAVLFEAISLVNVLGGPTPALQQSAVAQLGKFILAKETNLRYLALESMATLCDSEPALVKKHQKTITAALKELDVSIRRRALDLLYRMCDKEIAADIIEELLEYLNSSTTSTDTSIKEELVLKIAILAERFLEGTPAYVDTILRLIQTAGEFVSDEIWFRLVRVVVNREEIQEYAAKAVLKALRKDPWHETMVKVGGYILGEYGSLIADNANCSPMDQFKAMHSKWGFVSLPTKALLLSSYVKFVNVFPDISSVMREVFASNRDSIDAEVQQRACEYLALTTGSHKAAEELMQTVLDAIPAWDEAKVAATHALEQKEGEEEDKKLYKKQEQAQANLIDLLTGVDSSAAAAAGNAAGAHASSSSAATSGKPDNFLDMLMAGSKAPMTTVTPSTAPAPAVATAAVVAASLPMTPIAPLTQQQQQESAAAATQAATEQQLTQISEESRAQVKSNWLNLCVANEGVLFQDDTLQVGVKGEFSGASGRLVFFYANQTTTPVQCLTTSFSGLPELTLKATPLAQTLIGPKTQLQQAVHVTCLAEYNEIATMRVGYLSPKGKGNVQVELPVPVLINKFITAPEKKQIAAPEFVAQWKAMSAPGLELMQVFKAKEQIEMRKLRALITEGFKLVILEGIDTKESNLVLSGTLNVASQQPPKKIPVLVRLETNKELGMYRLTIRTESELASSSLATIFIAQIGA